MTGTLRSHAMQGAGSLEDAEAVARLIRTFLGAQRDAQRR